jgi:hypothetical protein
LENLKINKKLERGGTVRNRERNSKEEGEEE